MNAPARSTKPLKKGEGCLIWFAFIVFFCFGAFIVIWNAKRASGVNSRLKEAASTAIQVKPESIDPSLDGELVVLAGPIETENLFEDPYYEVHFNGATYSREVYSYQEEEGDFWWGMNPDYSDLTLPNKQIAEAYVSNSIQLKPEKPIRIGSYTIDAALLEADDLYLEPIPIDKDYRLEKGSIVFYPAELNAITNSRSFDYPEVGDHEVRFFGLANGSNLTILGIQKDSSIAKPEGKVPYGAIRGYRDAAAVVSNLKVAKEDIDTSFNFVGLFLLFIGSFAFRSLISGFLYRITNDQLLNLKPHVALTSIALWLFSYWLCIALGFTLFRQEYLKALIALGKALALAGLFYLLLINKIPKFLYK